VSLKAHIKALGYIYTGLACFVGLLAVLILIIYATQGKLSQAGVVVPILAALALWWLQTGLGLLRYRSSVRLYAVIVAVVFMVGLNALFLFAGGKPFSSSPGWIIFHLSCISVGIYTLVVMLLPGTGEVLQ
jgi:lysylphosphatidylglycerol synthetase-like protein (DUF2156 family)